MMDSSISIAGISIGIADIDIDIDISMGHLQPTTKKLQQARSEAMYNISTDQYSTVQISTVRFSLVPGL